MVKRIISIEHAPKAIGPYSQGVNVKEDYYFSGMLPINPETGAIEAETVSGQTIQILKNIHNLLISEQMDAQNVVKTTVYITDMKTFSEMNAEYANFFSLNPPARSCVEVSALPLGARVEIEIFAKK